MDLPGPARSFWLAIALTAVAASPAHATFTQEVGSPYPVGANPYGVGSGDFDGDGRPDLAVFNGTSSTVTILLREVGGGFSEEVGSPIPVGSGPSGIAVADFNGDSRPDIAVSSFVSNDVRVLLRQAGGGFAAEAPVAVPGRASSLAVADFNADSRPDLAVGNWDAGTVTTLLRQAGGGFAAEGAGTGTGTNPRAVVASDFDLDGDPDLAVTNFGSANVTILLRQAGGFVQEVGSPFAVGTQPIGVVSADFDGNGNPDLAVANYGSANASILLRQAGGGFAAAPLSPVATGTGPSNLAVGDFNGDGRRDLVVTNNVSDSVLTLLGRADGGFAGEATTPAGDGPNGIAAADFNADSHPDLAVTNDQSNDVSILLNDGVATPPPDPNPDPTPDPDPGPGPGPNPDAPVARLAPLSTAKLFQLLTFDASASTGKIVRYDWDLDGNGATDASCGGDQPKLTVRSILADAKTVSVKAIGTGGLSSLTQKTYVPPTGTKTPVKRLRGLASTLVCSAAKKVDVTLLGGPPDGCSTTVTYGLASAVGCLERITKPEDVPPRERATLDALIAAWNANPPIRQLTKFFCPAGGCGGLNREALIQATDFYASKSTVRVNGLDIEPVGGSTVVFHTQLGRIVSADARVRLGRSTLRAGGPLNLDVSTRSQSRVSLERFSGIRNLPVPGHFLPTGDLEIALTADGASRATLGTIWGTTRYENHRTDVTLSLAMPKIFSIFGGKPPTVNTVASTTNTSGFVLNALAIRVPSLNIGGMRLTDVSFDYLRSDPTAPCNGRSSWRGGGNLLFGAVGDAGLTFTPPPSERGIGFCGSSLSYAGGKFTFGPPGPPEPPVFPGVTLKSIGFDFGFEPTRLRGEVALNVARVAQVVGGLFVVFASPGEPYTLSTADAGGPLGKFAGTTFTRTTVAAGGQVFINIPEPVGRVDLGSGYFLYGYPDYVRLGGTMRFDIPGGHVSGTADGEVGVRSGAFNFQIGGEVCTVLCYGGTVLVSSAGIAACGKFSVTVPIVDEEIAWTPGLGWRYSETLPTIYLNGCDVGPFRAVIARAAQDGSRTFTVGAGDGQKLVRLIGTGGAPDIEVRGPDGQVVSTATGPIQDGTTIRIVRDTGNAATWVGVGEKFKPGTYTITPRAGSPAIAAMATAGGLPEPRVRASVTGRGQRRVLRYDVRRRANQRVTFVERGATTERRLGTVSGGKGRIRFAPGRGNPGTRRIVARIALSGLPVEERVVARYRASRPPKPGRPGKVQVRRRGKTLRVSWGPARAADRYVVIATPRGGTERVLRVGGGRRSTRVKGIPPTRGGRVSVHGLTDAGDAGRPRRARFRATRKAPSRFRKFSELDR